MLSLKTHGIFDYVIAFVLIISPFLFGFSEVNSARNLFLILGFGLAIYSLITKYYYSVLKIIPLGLHMTLDVLAGVILALAPYFFGYRGLITQGQMVYHVVLGLGAISLVIFTRTRTEKAKTPEERRLTSGGKIQHRRHV